MTIIDKIKWQNLMLMIGKNLMAILVKNKRRSNCIIKYKFLLKSNGYYL